jgi:flavin reductase (DIM6/NTAB) family NADH-FMN oxidoreductase RutF
MEVDLETLDLRERSALMLAMISPRAIAWVSTQGSNGSLNLAPFSFFTGIGTKPPTLCFAPANNRDGRKKDTLVNIEQTHQFVVNIVTEEVAAVMNQTSANYPYGVSEFEKAGLTPMPSIKVRPPAVKESPVQMECELLQVVSVSDGPFGGHLVIGKIVYVRVADRLWKYNKLSHKDLKPVGRMEGEWYSKVTDDFELPRPKI